jgi:hypothetical protein
MSESILLEIVEERALFYIGAVRVDIAAPHNGFHIA